MKNLILIVFAIGTSLSLIAQETTIDPGFVAGKKAKSQIKVVEKDSTSGAPVVNLSTVNINDKVFDSPIDKVRYDRLKINMEKVYPYAAEALGLLDDLNASTDEMSKKRQQKRYRKNLEKELKGRFKDELKNLTVTQGRILVEIIEKETGEPFYNLLKDLKNPMSAGLYNMVGKKHGYDLKEGYNKDEFPYFEDALAETVRKFKN